MMAAIRANNMTNRTTLLVIVAALSLLGSLSDTLQAQQPTRAQQQQIEEAVRALQQSKPPIPPTIPPQYAQDRPPALLKFVKDNGPWGGLIVAAAVGLIITIILGVVIGVCRIVGEFIRVLVSCCNRASGDGPRVPPSGGGT
jgi:hypothetical protein